MDSLARYLDTLFSAPDTMPHAVDATITHWRDVGLSNVTDSRHLVIGRKRQKTPDSSHRVESILHTQLQLPSHARITTHSESKDKTRDTLIVMNPDEWCVDNGEGSVERGNNGIKNCPHLTDVQRHFDGSLIREFFVGLRLEDHGTVTFLDSECVRFHAFPRTESRIWPHWLPSNADEYEMVGEITTGFLFSIAGILSERIYEKYEVTRIEHDAVFGDDVFSFNSESANFVEATKRVEHMASPSIAQSHVGFAVFVPTIVPENETSHLEVMLDHRSRGESPEVMLMYRGATSYGHLWIKQRTTADCEEDEYEWEEISLPDTTARISDPGEEGMRIVSLVKDGTHISIVTDLARPLALKVASSLEQC